ncbi:MAG: redoxin family protein [Planctomycetes bacterium]|nr:redoxin family protein [Planctomycetota bacterium]
MIRPLLVCLAFALLAFVPLVSVAQEQPPAPDTPKVKEYATYDALFDDFDKRRKVLITQFERLQQKERVEPNELRKAEGELMALDHEYAGALRMYIDNHTGAKDLMPARFENAVTLSRLEDRLQDAVKAADEFLKNHADSDLAPDARFVKAQTLFRMPGSEDVALVALEQFIEKHPERQDANAARMMRVRTLLFLDRVADAKRALDMLIKSDKVKGDEDARAFLQGQLDALDWIGRDMPAFSIKDVDGKALASADWIDKPYLVFVWDTTSAPCLGELPFVQEVHKRHGEKMPVLGISVNESKPAFEQWLGRNPDAIKFRSAWMDRVEEGTLIKKLSVSVIPFNVLVDAKGKVYRYDVRSDDLMRYAARLAK